MTVMENQQQQQLHQQSDEQQITHEENEGDDGAYSMAGMRQAISNHSRDYMTVQCPNYLVCKNAYPSYLLRAHGGKCLDCNINLGVTLTIRHGRLDGSDGPCPICLEDVSSGGSWVIIGPSCRHLKCLECFRRCWFWDGAIPEDPRPAFPFPHRWVEYEQAQVDSRGRRLGFADNVDDVALRVEQWMREDEMWELRNMQRREDRPRNKCPLCRHRHVPPSL